MDIQFKDLSHTYDRSTHAVLSIADWRIRAGEQILLRGVSGSGKTTLFNITAGLLKPTHGTVCYDDQSLYALPEARRDRFRAKHIGYIFQSHYLMSTLNALENVMMPLAFTREIPASEWRPMARKLLETVGLGDRLHYRPSQLSTGQRMRVAVARALVTQPSVVLADEPTASLDSENSAIVMELIQQTCTERNAILVVSSHDPALRERFSHVVDLHEGHLSTTTESAAML